MDLVEIRVGNRLDEELDPAHIATTVGHRDRVVGPWVGDAKVPTVLQLEDGGSSDGGFEQLEAQGQRTVADLAVGGHETIGIRLWRSRSQQPSKTIRHSVLVRIADEGDSCDGVGPAFKGGFHRHTHRSGNCYVASGIGRREGHCGDVPAPGIRLGES